MTYVIKILFDIADAGANNLYVFQFLQKFIS